MGEGVPAPCDSWHITLVQVEGHLWSIFPFFKKLRSFCKIAASVSLVTAIYKIVLSANSRTLDCYLAGRSFINTKNSIGPIKDPWGTPLVTETHEDIFPSHTALRCRWCKKLSIHWLIELLIPYPLSLRINFLWDTLSKAFAKSITITSVWLLSRRFLYRSWTNVRSWVSFECFALNPCCSIYSMLLHSRCFIMCFVTTCSIIFDAIQVSEMGR